MDSEPFAYNLTSSFLKGLKYHIIKIPVHQSEEETPEAPGLSWPLSFNWTNFVSKDSTVFKKASILVSIPSSWTTCITYYHSYAITKNYIVFLEQPLLVNALKLATCTPKGKPLKDCFEWCPDEKVSWLEWFAWIDGLCLNFDCEDQILCGEQVQWQSGSKVLFGINISFPSHQCLWRQQSHHLWYNYLRWLINSRQMDIRKIKGKSVGRRKSSHSSKICSAFAHRQKGISS